ncbi:MULTISPECIES: ATP-binding cassette domain-containing protein [Clostridium]|uniref:Oligopeptide ABC transporter ATP-binding protein n=1 Tax=Clostridium disporicum TaxID=84024 RepID=A0A173XEF7_9CLOT|nr:MULTISPECIES: ATP-binding cassette domain-containing protein [Clostridium]MCD2502833.1 ATP-binding cassette domain-containing protein [Clostridium sp. NSJ-145]CUN50063.1 oligopeptide ABC transporter ATP-binding protein [Clostridium disporicum]
MNKEKLLEIKSLKQYFTLNNNKIIKAIDDVSLDIYKGEFLGLIGESGSGKSTLGKSIVGINKITGGEIKYDGITISDKKSKRIKREIISKKIQFIFQDSTSCLNSRMTVKDIIEEPMKLQKLYKSKKEREKVVYDLLDVVGLDRSSINKYPYDLSGGQRQRVGIARAISTKPEFIIADEPIASLDVSMQAQIINLFKKIKKNNNLTFLFISHDLSMVRYISDRIAVIYKGKIVEVAPTDELYSNPIHPYTKMLIAANLQEDNSSNKKDGFKNKDYDIKYNENYNEDAKWIEVSKEHFVLIDKLI